MSCSPFDLKDYFLKELPAERARWKRTSGMPACREELDRLRLTGAALFSLRDEEIPRRIAFVSDQVFEPSPWRRWWERVLGIHGAAGLRLGGHAFGRVEQAVDRAMAVRTRQLVEEVAAERQKLLLVVAAELDFSYRREQSSHGGGARLRAAARGRWGGEMRIVPVILLALAPLAAQVARPVSATARVAAARETAPPRVSLVELAKVSRAFDRDLQVFAPADPVDVLGNTRGIYLEGFGAVFTTELSPIRTPGISPFRPNITDEEKRAWARC
jgi:hypothetical protein